MDPPLTALLQSHTHSGLMSRDRDGELQAWKEGGGRRRGRGGDDEEAGRAEWISNKTEIEGGWERENRGETL